MQRLGVKKKEVEGDGELKQEKEEEEEDDDEIESLKSSIAALTQSLDTKSIELQILGSQIFGVFNYSD